MARLMWVLAVAGLMTRRSAISSLDRPCAAKATASRSRLVSFSSPPPMREGGGLGDVPVDELASDGGCEQGVTAGGDAYGVQEVLRQDVLDQETGGAGAQRVEDVLVHAVVGQHDDVYVGQGRVRGDAPGRLDAVHDGHLDVDESDVGQPLLGEREALLAVGGLGHHLDVVLEVEQRAEAAADERLVIDQQDPDHEAPFVGSSARTVKPPALRGSVRRRPPRAVTRSRMPSSPSPGVGAGYQVSFPLSSTRMARASGR